MADTQQQSEVQVPQVGVGSSPLKKLGDLRVVDLRNELDKRGLEKSGVKAVLCERLQKAIEGEGHTISEYVFDISPEKKSGPKETSMDTTTEEPDMSTEGAPVNGNVEHADFDDEEGVEVGDEDDRDGLDGGEEEEAVDAEEENDETAALDEIDDPQTCEDVDEEGVPEKEEEQPATSAAAPTMTQQPAMEANNLGDAVKSKEPEEKLPTAAVPSAEAAEPAAVITSSETTADDSAVEKLDDSSVSKVVEVDDLSLVVHVDEKDLDPDLTADISNLDNVSAEPDDKMEASPAKSAANGKNAGDRKSGSSSKPSLKENVDGPITTTSTKTGESSKGKSGTVSSSATKSSSAAKVDKDGKHRSPEKGSNLWVSNLSSSTRANDLKAHFSKYGKVVGAKIVTNAKAPGSRCYGYITMATPDQASKCIQYLHRSELHGRVIYIDRAKNDMTAPKSRTSSDVTKKDTSSSTRKDDAGKARESRISRSSRPTGGNIRSGERPHTAAPDKGKEADKVKAKDDEGKSKETSGGDANKDEKKPAEEKDDKTEEKKDDADKEAGTDENKVEEKKDVKNEKKSQEKSDIVSFDNIKKRREADMAKRRERERREMNRRRQIEEERIIRQQRMMEKRNREERDRIFQEKEALRMEKERLARERAEIARLERERLERERMERERREREFREQRRLEQLRFEESKRTTIKRGYDGRDSYYDERKRHGPDRTVSTTYDSVSSGRYSDVDSRGSMRYGGGGASSYSGGSSRFDTTGRHTTYSNSSAVHDRDDRHMPPPPPPRANAATGRIIPAGGRAAPARPATLARAAPAATARVAAAARSSGGRPNARDRHDNWGKSTAPATVSGGASSSARGAGRSADTTTRVGSDRYRTTESRYEPRPGRDSWSGTASSGGAASSPNKVYGGLASSGVSQWSSGTAKTGWSGSGSGAQRSSDRYVVSTGSVSAHGTSSGPYGASAQSGHGSSISVVGGVPSAYRADARSSGTGGDVFETYKMMSSGRRY